MSGPVQDQRGRLGQRHEISLSNFVFEVSPENSQTERRAVIAEALESGSSSWTVTLGGIEGVTVLPDHPGTMRCVSYVFSHLLEQEWATLYDLRLNPPPWNKEPLIVDTVGTLTANGFAPVEHPKPESVKAGDLVVYGNFYKAGYKMITARTSDGVRFSYPVETRSGSPSFVAEHFGLVVQNDKKSPLLVESKFGRGPACIHQLELAPYGKDLIFFRPPSQGGRAP